MSESPHDPWADWLLSRRHGGDAGTRQRLLEDVDGYRDRVLDGARLTSGMTVVDVGAGEGLLAFGAIARIGPSLSVILTDISLALLRHAEGVSADRGVRSQCTFIQGSAECLSGISDAVADLVMTRASLAYVPDKVAALREFHRVLKPGGRISLGEPLFRDQALEGLALAKLLEAHPDHPDAEFLRLLQRCRAAQFPATEAAIAQHPLTHYSERDLLRMARDAGFTNLHLEMHIDLRPARVTSWEVFLDMSPHPLAPTLREIFTTQFTPAEAALLEQIMRPGVEAGQSIASDQVVYLTAEKGHVQQ